VLNEAKEASMKSIGILDHSKIDWKITNKNQKKM
jgi:hypothetical protein